MWKFFLKMGAEIVSIIAIVFGFGFAAGYAVRAAIPHHHHARAERTRAA
jgi:hypothetical protein